MKKMFMLLGLLLVFFAMGMNQSYARDYNCPPSCNCQCEKDCNCGCCDDEVKKEKCSCCDGECKCSDDCSCKKVRKFLFFHKTECSGNCDCALDCDCKQ